MDVEEEEKADELEGLLHHLGGPLCHHRGSDATLALSQRHTMHQDHALARNRTHKQRIHHLEWNEAIK
eukprot:8447566-Pyramimonas_sp.AAC.1